jgi:Protein of unknown function (DUF1302)
MPGVGTGLGRAARGGEALVALVAMGLATALGVALPAARAGAVEAFDGRIQLHGFAEEQVRTLNDGFNQEFDLAQWYNVLNLEFEFDIAPDGFGPIDLLSAYVRVEGRYDAIYSQGFGLFPSVNTYGDFSTKGALPNRLRDAVNPDVGGVLRVGPSVPRMPDRRPVPFVPQPAAINFGTVDAAGRPAVVMFPGENQGYPGFDTLYRQAGADNILGTADDPARYAQNKLEDFYFTFKDFRGPELSSSQTQILGPWLPRNFIVENALNKDRANPFRGRISPQAPSTWAFSIFPASVAPDGIRYYQGDPALPANYAGRIDPLDPRLKKIAFAPDSVLTDNGNVLNKFFPKLGNAPAFAIINITNPDANQVVTRFGGDYSGIVPCIDPTNELAEPQRDGSNETPFCIPGSPITKPLNVAITGGRGENPFRPGPDLSNLDLFNYKNLQAQGLYIPSKGLQRELLAGTLDPHDFNIDQTRREFNRGASQERGAKEIKEAYIDVEMLDSRLWMRLGLQNIVWGKTELFRTTDQFNPQDLALASLPSLEESRIALWSARFVYSLYDVGPLEDVRLEFAFNFDKYQPADLGACGEPYTPDVVCTLTNGLVAHGLLGVGVVGQDRPPDPWKDIGGLELGGRVEWRWDRFSFALVDFYGYSDYPFPDAINFYERGVDPATGRPLVARLPGQPLGTCANAGEATLDVRSGLVFNSAVASHALSVTPGARTPDGVLRRGGVGTDMGCLRPGGAPGNPNAFRFDQGTLAYTNALQNSPVNQQIFAWICENTIGIAAALDAGSCAWTIFGSNAILKKILPFPFIEFLTPVLAGDTSGFGVQSLFSLVYDSQKNGAVNGQIPPVPLATINSLFLDPVDVNANTPKAPSVANPDRNGDGVADGFAFVFDDRNGDGMISLADMGGYDGFDGRIIGSNTALQTLDRGLTNEQRALLGCGPFYAMRCDSSVQRQIVPRTPVSLADLEAYGAYGGLDFMNTEASALMQSWPGFEGTLPGYYLTSTAAAPGTVGFHGGPVCTRFVEFQGLVKLPGCRGVQSVKVVHDADGNPIVEAKFDRGYLPSIDGCVIGSRITLSDGTVVPVIASGGGRGMAGELPQCNNATTRKVVPRFFLDGSGNPTIPNPACVSPVGIPPSPGVQAQQICNAQIVTLEQLPLIHPLAGCQASPVDPSGGVACRFWFNRDLTQEFLDGNGQLFQNELAAVSYNFMQFLVVSSCDQRSVNLDGKDHRGPNDIVNDPECFNAKTPYSTDRCSLNTPYYCTNVKGFFSAAGVTSNVERAGGNGFYGRRTFIWQSGGELVLRYNKRNVLGLSADFAEDVTKTNWGVEFTWVKGNPFQDASSDVGISRTDAINLTLSVDRPTFINFLNPNRTFFFNSQWFFNYLPDYNSGYSFNGPVNVLFTFAVFTGYFQDRLNPQFVTVYDFLSSSGALLPSLEYRFTESFSVTIGLNYFFGHTQLKDAPIADFAPTSNRSGANAYYDGADNILAAIRQHDELFLRLRWTF